MGFPLLRLMARRRDVVCLGVGAMLCVGSVVAAPRVKVDAWQHAVDAREAFEAEPAGTHTKAEYAGVMDEFRAIYHGNPGDGHAARAIEQVAELLVEQGRELGDRKSLKDAAGQYEFLAKAYPGYAKRALAAEAALEDAQQGSGATTPAAPVQGSGTKVQGSAGMPVRKSRATVDEEIAAARSSGVEMSEPSSHAANSSAAVTTDAGRSSSRRVQSDVVATDVAPAPIVRTAGDDAAPVATSHRMAQVTGIRHWSTATYSRVAIDLGDEVEYQAARVENPDRIYFDLHHSRLAQELVGKSFAVTDDGFLTKIRAAQFSNDVTRVVLDVHEVGDYSAFLLPNPYRLIIDIHGKAANGKQQVASSEQPTVNSEQRASGGEDAYPQASANPPVYPQASANSPAYPQASANPPPVTHQGGVEVSALPPMPVTDGSKAFGLPARSAGNQAVAQPRVVIPQKSTSAKPVPNTVTSRGGDTGVEIAAVSDQQGRVEATSKPTSQPIVARSSDKGSEQLTANSQQSSNDAVGAKRSHIKRGGTIAQPQPHMEGEPTEPPPPTADGETLVRALGLKIGRIVIDAGHGGHDSGTLGVGGIEEKDVVLDVALRLGKLLHDRLGAEIVYTRADDTFIPLETRTAIANKAQADLFISIHANSSADASARGVEVYYLNFTSDPEAMKVAGRENAVSTQSVHELSDLVKKIALKDKIDESKELATDVDEALYAGITKGNAGLKNRGVKKAPFVVLIGANMPSILAEISFVTNPDDAEQLQRPAYRERVAESLYNGVAQYAGGINGKKAVKSTERAARAE
jgi:N-acetylmuramoyl-L-alanine amidase